MGPFGIFNPYTGDFWTTRTGRIQSHGTKALALKARRQGQREWARENGTQLTDGECLVRRIPTPKRKESSHA
jgi:hypothetical protein